MTRERNETRTRAWSWWVASILLVGIASVATAQEEPRIEPLPVAPREIAIAGPRVIDAKRLTRLARRSERRVVRRRTPKPATDDYKSPPGGDDCGGFPCFEHRLPPDGGDQSPSPETVNPPWELDLGNKNDPQIAVSRSHVVVTAYNVLQVLTKDGSAVLTMTASDLFEPLWSPSNLQNINTTLNLPNQLECNPLSQTPALRTFCLDDYYDTRVIYDAFRDRFWITSLARNSTTRDEVKNATLHEHTMDDETAGRRSKVLVAVSRTSDPLDGFYLYAWDAVVDDGICFNTDFDQPCPGSIYRPGDGGDYPSIGISRFFYLQTNSVAQRYPDPDDATGEKTKTRVRYTRLVVADADELASGNPAPGWELHGGEGPFDLKNPPLPGWPPGGPPPPEPPLVEGLQPAVQHSDTPAGLAYLTSISASRLVVWGFSPLYQAPPALYRVVVPLQEAVNVARNPAQPDVPPVYARPLNMANLQRFPTKSVYRDDNLYAVWHDCRSWEPASDCSTSNRLLRVNVAGFLSGTIPTTPASGFVDRTFGLRNDLEDAATDVIAYGNPAIEVNRQGDMVIVYNRSSDTVFPEARYNVYYAAEPDIRPSTLLHAGNFFFGTDFVPGADETEDDGKPKATGNVDTGGASVDPWDDLAIWVAHTYAAPATPGPFNARGIWEIAVGKVFGRTVADLVVSKVAFPKKPAAPSGTINITVTLKNQGDGIAPATTTALYVSSDDTLSSTDTLLLSGNVPAIPSGQSYVQTFSAVPLPASPKGPRYVIAWTDSADVATEYVESNNRLAKKLGFFLER